MATRDVGATPALLALHRAGVAHVVREYDHDPRAASFGEKAARQLELDPSTVFKTLVARVGARLTIAVVPVDGRLDLKALARTQGAKGARLADRAEAERATGCVVGGISPIAPRTALTTVIDSTAAGLSIIYVSGGRRGLEVGLSPQDLITITSAAQAPIARR